MPSLFEAATQSYEEIEKYQEMGGVDLLGVTTGFGELDYVLGGFRKDAYYTIAGRSGGGKSALATSMILYQAKAGNSVYLASLEMSAPMLATRLLASHAGVNALALERGRITKDQLKNVDRARKDMQDLDVFLDDESTTTEELKNSLYDRTQSKDVDIVYADYTSLFKDAASSPFEKETNVSNELRGIAREMDVPMVALAQLNRNSLQRESSKPILSDLKNSGQHEQNSQSVIFIHRPHIEAVYSGEAEPANEEDAELIVAKNRSGPSGVTIDVIFEPRKMLWRDKLMLVNDPPNLREK